MRQVEVGDLGQFGAMVAVLAVVFAVALPLVERRWITVVVVVLWWLLLLEATMCLPQSLHDGRFDPRGDLVPTSEEDGHATGWLVGWSLFVSFSLSLTHSLFSLVFFSGFAFPQGQWMERGND